MHKTKVDYIIVGQGIAGSWLAHELLQRGKSIAVINHETDKTASLKAAGLYNPITGRKMVKTWMADELFQNLEKDYSLLEKKLSASFLHPKSIYRAFRNVEDRNDWDGKQDDSSINKFIKEIKTNSTGIQELNDPLGGILLNHSGYVDLPKFIHSFRNFLVSKEVYRSELFDYTELTIDNDGVNYKELKSGKIIFCEGSQIENPFWKHLPFKLVRGELIDIECNCDLPFIFNQGVFMIPKKKHITVGSTYDHSILSFDPQPSGIQNLRSRLEKVFSGSYKIIEERAGIRPATFDRKPFIGMHHKIKTLCIFNGFGTKGVSLTPYFAKHFADVLENKCELDKNIDVQRVN